MAGGRRQAQFQDGRLQEEHRPHPAARRFPRPADGVEGILQCVQVGHQSDTGSVYAQLAAQEAVPGHLCRRVAQERGTGTLSRLFGQQQDDRLAAGIEL